MNLSLKKSGDPSKERVKKIHQSEKIRKWRVQDIKMRTIKLLSDASEKTTVGSKFKSEEPEKITKHVKMRKMSKTNLKRLKRRNRIREIGKDLGKIKDSKRTPQNQVDYLVVVQRTRFDASLKLRPLF
ncbi:hypothetical protein TNCT_259261 [Trichonephila clavata]|uniref:Uncharacterized protein n=1 Tax=Trichonephila clavata TaxID=2740835 RepID=A0A8X6H6B3_TRICU|nr:hypothetical protein TNCT_259261 [Trichonephila clavata]